MWIRMADFHSFQSERIYVCQRTGWLFIYLYSPTGVMQRQVTKGNWDVTRLIGYDDATKVVYYESAERVRCVVLFIRLTRKA